MNNSKYVSYLDFIERIKSSIPKHWETKRAKSIFHSIDERSVDGKELLLSVSEHKGVVPRKDINVTMFMAKSYSGYKICKEGDLVINSLWAWGRGIGVSKYHGIVSTAYGVYRLKTKNQFNSCFLNYLLRTRDYVSIYFMRSKGVWISRLQLLAKNFLDIPIVVPPINEQNKIVEFLDDRTEKITNFINKKQRIIALLKEQRQSIIDASMKDYSTEGWLSKRLKYISELRFSNVDKHSIDNETDIRLCNYVDVYNNDYITNNLPFMFATASESEIKKFKITKGDILLTKDSEDASDIAVPSYVVEDLDNVVCGYHLAMIRADESQILSEYLYRAIQSKRVNIQFEIAATGVTRVGLSLDDIKSARVYYPISINKQKEITDYIRAETISIDSAIAKSEKEIELVREYEDRVIAEAVTGKINI